MNKDFLWGGAVAANQYEGGYNEGNKGLSVTDVMSSGDVNHPREISFEIKKDNYYEPPLSSRQVKKLKTCTHACHVVAGIFLCIMCCLIFLYRLVLRYWILNWILIAQCFTSYFIRCSHTKSSLISFMTVISYPFYYCLF